MQLRTGRILTGSAAAELQLMRKMTREQPMGRLMVNYLHTMAGHYQQKARAK